MANAPDAQGTSAEQDGATVDAPDEALVTEDKKYTEAEHKAAIERIMKTRLAKLQKEASRAAALEQEIADLKAQIEDKGSSSKSEVQILQDRLAKLEKEGKAKVAEAEAKIAEERKARHEAIIGHALQREIAKRGFREPEIVEAYLRRSLVVSDDGEVVRRDGEHLQTDLGTVMDEFAKAHQSLLSPPPSGEGSRSGKPPKGGRKGYHEMTRGELDAAADKELREMPIQGRAPVG